MGESGRLDGRALPANAFALLAKSIIRRAKRTSVIHLIAIMYSVSSIPSSRSAPLSRLGLENPLPISRSLWPYKDDCSSETARIINKNSTSSIHSDFKQLSRLTGLGCKIADFSVKWSILDFQTQELFEQSHFPLSRSGSSCIQCRVSWLRVVVYNNRNLCIRKIVKRIYILSSPNIPNIYYIHTDIRETDKHLIQVA